MSTNLLTVSNILKEQYLPALQNQITSAPSPFLEMIEKVPLTGGKVSVLAPFGINGGFGFGTDGGNTPTAASRVYKRFEVDPVDMYVDIRISDKTLKMAKGSNALVSALEEEVKGSYDSAKWNVARSLFGDSSGVLTTVVDIIPGIDSNSKGIIVNDTSKLIEGLTIDFYNFETTSSVEGFLPENNKGLHIISVNRETSTIYVDSANISKKATQNSYVTCGYICVQGSYKKELTGLGSIFFDRVKTLYGLSKEKNPSIVPKTISCENHLTDTLIYDAVKMAKDYKGSNINLVMMGDQAFRAYQNYMRANNTVVAERAEFVGGATGYKVMVGSQIVTIVNERMVPTTEAWCVDTHDFVFSLIDFDFCDYGNSGVFQLVPGTSHYRALLASYGNLICKNPGGCVKLTNCEEILPETM